MTTTDDLDFKHHSYKEMRQVRSRFVKEKSLLCPEARRCLFLCFYGLLKPQEMLVVSRLRMPWGSGDQRKPPSPASG